MDSSNPIFVYLDNSNIFLSTQGFSSKLKHYNTGISDSQCRIEANKLLEIVLAGRSPTLKKAYGQMTKEVKHEFEKAGFSVFLSDSKYGEKEVDTQLTADAVEDILLHKFRPLDERKVPQKGTLIILSGDKDMRPVVKVARKYEWDVELWAYTESLSEGLTKEMKRKEYGSKMEVKPLEDHFQKFTFYDYRQMESKKDKMLLVRFEDKGSQRQRLDEPTKKNMAEVVRNQAEFVFHLPMSAEEVQVTGRSSEHAVSVVCALEQGKGKGSLYNFERDILNSVAIFEYALKQELERKFGMRNIRVTNLEGVDVRPPSGGRRAAPSAETSDLPSFPPPSFTPALRPPPARRPLSLRPPVRVSRSALLPSPLLWREPLPPPSFRHPSGGRRE